MVKTKGRNLTQDKGNLQEIFASVQGEGILVGVSMIFVRLSGCARRCRYCDSDFTWTVAKEAVVHQVGNGGRVGETVVANPVTAKWVMDTVSCIARSEGDLEWVTITGGEPLLQPGFVQNLAKRMKDNGFRTILETEGDQPEALADVIEFIDVVAADIKLPSTTGESLDWDIAGKFLELAARRRVSDIEFTPFFVKVVVTPEIEHYEFNRAVDLVASLDSDIPFIVQPVTPALHVPAAPAPSILWNLAKRARSKLNDVRVVPQVHTQLGLL